MSDSVYIKTLGCKVNTFDSHALENQFKAAGFQLSRAPGNAHITVINSCSVTANAEKEARYLLRRFRRENPKTLLVITGCYAQVNSGELTDLPEVDLVIPNEKKDELVQLLKYRKNDADAWRGKMPRGVHEVRQNKQGHFKSSATLFASAKSEQTRAFLKVQDGCNNFCTYCLIPYARGASRSVPLAEVVQEAKRLDQDGCGELVLTGIHIGDYGDDFLDSSRPIRLVTALQEILLNTSIPRIRISSLEPSEVAEDMLDLMAQYPDRFCDHFHLPLQSGCDTVLKRMRRTYDTAAYADAVSRIRQRFPDANIGADVIPGFPGETDHEVAATLSFIQSQNLSYLHVFPYSRRPNTAANRMPGHITPTIVKDRASDLRELSKKLRRKYAKSQIGRVTHVLWEQEQDTSGRQYGHTRNYLKVAAPKGTAVLAGTETAVRLKGLLDDQTLLAQPLS